MTKTKPKKSDKERKLTRDILLAAKVWTLRRNRLTHPSGAFDNKGRWYPDASERKRCCDNIRIPSKAFPYSLNTHCRSVEHIARRFNVPVIKLKRRLREPLKVGTDIYCDGFKVEAKA